MKENTQVVSDLPIRTIKLFSGENIPIGWKKADGKNGRPHLPHMPVEEDDGSVKDVPLMKGLNWIIKTN